MSHETPTDLAPSSDKDNATHWLERLGSHLLQTNGVNGEPLAYIVRENVAVTLSANDTPYNYASEKLI